MVRGTKCLIPTNASRRVETRGDLFVVTFARSTAELALLSAISSASWVTQNRGESGIRFIRLSESAIAKQRSGECHPDWLSLGGQGVLRDFLSLSRCRRRPSPLSSTTIVANNSLTTISFW